MITKKLKSISIVALALIMALTLGIGISGFSKPVAEVNAATTKISIFDGTKDTVAPANNSTVTDATTGVTYTPVGMGDLSEKTAAKEAGYTKVWPSGGSTSSSSKYIEITVPEGCSVVFNLLSVSNGSEVRSSFVSKTKTKTLDQSICYCSATQTPDAVVQSEPQGAGTYYVCFTASSNMCLLTLDVTSGPKEATVTYDAGEGTFATASDDVTFADGAETYEYTIVSGEPTAPEGKRFAGWSDGTNVYQPGGVVTISKDITLTAVYDVVIYALYNPLAIAKTYRADLTVADLNLPSTVEAKTVEGNVDVAVIWDTAEIEAAGFVAGDYVISGAAQPTAGYVYDCETAVSITVKINATAPKLTAIAQPEQINVLALSSSVTLPQTVVATVEGMGEVELPVEWSSNYDLNVVNEYTLSGTVNVGEDYDLNGQTVTLILNVYALNIVSAEPVSVTTAIGVAPALPGTVIVTLEDASKVALPVTWGTADTSAVGNVTVNGEITLNASYTNTNSVVAVASVNVVNITTVVWNAYDDQTDTSGKDGGPKEYGVKWTDTYPDGVLGLKNGIKIVASTGAITPDADRDQMYPMLQLKSGDVTIVIPENAKDITLKLCAGIYSNKVATFELRKDGVAVDGSKSVSASVHGDLSAADANNAFYAFTPDEFTYNLASGGTYVIKNTTQSVYITNIEISAAVAELAGVTYDAGEGTEAPAYNEYELNGTVTVGPAPVAPYGYKFVCWNDGETDYLPGDTFVITGSKTFTATYVEEIVSVVAKFGDVTKIKADVDEALALGDTAVEIFNLATTVSGRLIDGTEVYCDLLWDVSALTEAGYAEGVYNLTGTILAHAEYPFNSGVSTATTVKIVIRGAKAEIVSVGSIEDIKVELGTDAIELPEQVEVTLDDETTANVTVIWDNNYDLDTVNTYEVKGTIELGEEYLNTAGVEAIVNVVVYNYEITSVNAVADVKAFVGGTCKLPAKVTAKYLDINGDEQTVELEVNWDESTINLGAAGEYVATGLVEGTALYVVPGEITASVKVIVGEYVAASTARSTDFTVQHPSAVNRGFTFTGLAAKESGNFAGAKVKNGSVSFTLTAAANVTFVTYYEKSGITLSLTKDAVTVPGLAFATGSVQTQTVALEAGSYTLNIVGTAGSAAIRAIVIDDGGSEVFLAQSATGKAVLPQNAPVKVVNGVEYSFTGWAGLDGTTYEVGDEVTASEIGVTYYATYEVKSTILKGAALRATTEKMMRFEAYIDMLNADLFYDLFIANGKLAITAEVENGENAVVEGAKVVDIKGDRITIYLVVAITDNTEIFTASYSIVFDGETNTEIISFSADVVAQAVLAQVSDTQDAFYQFAMEDGKFSCYTDEERERLSAYLAPAEII